MDLAKLWLGLLLMLLPLGAQGWDAAGDRLWRALLHYQPAAGGGWRSRVVSPEFFLTADGATSPQAEWRALRQGLEGSAAAALACRFPARSRHLLQVLGRPPVTGECPALQRWRARLPVDGVSLVFADAFLNNPPSMFGHTMLRLDAAGSRDGGELLAWAVTYAARTDDPFGPAYAWRGLTGGYAGRFAIQPYYDKVRNYGHIENRDLWEFALDLSAASRRRLRDHLWELRGMDMPYSFLRHNCSFELLTLLEVADPSVDLLAQFPLWVIPARSVAAVAQMPGLVRAVNWRPSLQRRIQAGVEALSPAARNTLSRWRPGEAFHPAGLATAEQRAVLELAFALAEYRGVSADGHDPVLAPLLDQRRALGGGEAATAPSRPSRPDLAQAGSRASTGVGRNAAGQPAARLGLRASYHALGEPDHGLPDGAQIRLADLELSVSAAGARLEELALLDVASLAPHDTWMRAWSWRLGLGYRRFGTAGEWQGLAGIGKTLRLGHGWRGSALAVGQLGLDDALRSGHALRVGLQSHLRRPWGGGQFWLHGAWYKGIAGDRRTRREVGLSQFWSPAAAWALQLELGREWDSRQHTQLFLTLHRYW